MVEETRIPVIVLGASGYSGGELLRFAVRHKNIDIVALSGELSCVATKLKYPKLLHALVVIRPPHFCR